MQKQPKPLLSPGDAAASIVALIANEALDVTGSIKRSEKLTSKLMKAFNDPDVSWALYSYSSWLNAETVAANREYDKKMWGG